MISIVSAYYNRKPQFYRTLKSISSSEIKDFEYIVADDGSSNEHRLEDLINEFPFLRVIRVEPKDKWYVNPCIPFNKGIFESKGNIILLQNPESNFNAISEKLNEFNVVKHENYDDFKSVLWGIFIKK